MPDNPLIVKRQIKGCVNSPGQPFMQSAEILHDSCSSHRRIVPETVLREGIANPAC
jgi:hypothetical protein